MQNTDFSYETSVAASQKLVYQALTEQLGLWWGISKEGVTKVGDIMTIGFEENPSCWTFQASELAHPKRVVLTCIDASHSHNGLPDSIHTEWIGSKLIINISGQDNLSTIQFTHQGLTSQLKCYHVCVSGWNYYLGEALQEYLLQSSD